MSNQHNSESRHGGKLQLVRSGEWSPAKRQVHLDEKLTKPKGALDRHFESMGVRPKPGLEKAIQFSRNKAVRIGAGVLMASSLLAGMGVNEGSIEPNMPPQKADGSTEIVEAPNGTVENYGITEGEQTPEEIAASDQDAIVTEQREAIEQIVPDGPELDGTSQGYTPDRD